MVVIKIFKQRGIAYMVGSFNVHWLKIFNLWMKYYFFTAKKRAAGNLPVPGFLGYKDGMTVAFFGINPTIN